MQGTTKEHMEQFQSRQHRHFDIDPIGTEIFSFRRKERADASSPRPMAAIGPSGIIEWG
jgi:hypothetical protein